MPVEVIENVVSRDMARRYLQFDIKVRKKCLINKADYTFLVSLFEVFFSGRKCIVIDVKLHFRYF